MVFKLGHLKRKIKFCNDRFDYTDNQKGNMTVQCWNLKNPWALQTQQKCHFSNFQLGTGTHETPQKKDKTGKGLLKALCTFNNNAKNCVLKNSYW